MDVTSIGQTLWVCGAHELIAKSEDGGKSWQTAHQNDDGEILLKVTFLNASIGFAAGTNGAFLNTSDGGKNWIARPPGGETILDISFSDASHGIRRTRKMVETTSDGGLHWTPISFLLNDPVASTYDNILSVASLDSSHALVSLHRTQGENIFVLTEDGGNSWKSLHLDNTFAGNVFIHAGEYWAFGVEYLDRANHGGYSAPAALHSVDGETWKHGVRSPAEFNSCTQQGCVIHAYAIADLYGEQPRFFAVPAGESLGPNWALTGSTLCAVGKELRCVEVSESAVLPPRPEMEGRRKAGVGIPLAYETQSTQIPHCLRCDFGSFPVQKSVRGTGNIELELQIRKDGTVRSAKMNSSLPTAVRSGVESMVQEWFFEPAHGADGTVEQKQSIKVGLQCFAPPDSEQGSCVLRPALPVKQQ